MSLLVIFFVAMLAGASIAVGISLLVEQFYARASVFVFIVLYFGSFWLSWKAAVKVSDRLAAD
jgi:hypothetical protein